MRSEIRALHRRLGVNSILVTHDQLEATTMADRIICMRAGRIEQIGTPDDLYHRPASLFVAGFIGAPPINLLPGRLDQGILKVGAAMLPCETMVTAGDVVLGLRPEALSFGDVGFTGRIDEIEPMRRETLYLVDSELGWMRVLEAGSTIHHVIGEAVHIQFAQGDGLLFDQATTNRIDGADVRLPV